MSKKWCYFIILALPLFFIVLISLFPCGDSFLIGFCGLGKIILIAAVILFGAVLSLVFTWMSKKYLKEKSSAKKLVAVYLISLLLTLSPLILLLVTNRISSISSSIKYQSMLNQINPKKLESFKISNFSENPVINKDTGKYAGIEVTFDLTVEKTGLYRGGVNISHPDYFDSAAALFGSKNTFNERIEKNKSFRFSYILKTEKILLREKIDGPYYISILMRFDDEGSKWYKNDPGIFITGDPKGINEKMFSRTPIKYVEALRTRKYSHTDFLFQ